MSFRPQWFLRSFMLYHHEHRHAKGNDSIEHSPALSWQGLPAQPGKKGCHTRFADLKEINKSRSFVCVLIDD